MQRTSVFIILDSSAIAQSVDISSTLECMKTSSFRILTYYQQSRNEFSMREARPKQSYFTSPQPLVQAHE